MTNGNKLKAEDEERRFGGLLVMKDHSPSKVLGGALYSSGGDGSRSCFLKDSHAMFLQIAV
jgi:hypothetical protein